MTQNEHKQQASQAAVNYLKNVSSGPLLIGIGTGSTVNYFIDALAASDIPIFATVSSSEASTARLQQHQIKVLALNELDTKIAFYIDGTDEINAEGHLIKGGGGALTREKIIASASQEFICIADASKQVNSLGHFPLPIEVIPMAASIVTQTLSSWLGKTPVLRKTSSGEPFITDNQNVILDISGLTIDQPQSLEENINQIPGVVTVGLFARRGADLALISTDHGVQQYRYKAS